MTIARACGRRPRHFVGGWQASGGLLCTLLAQSPLTDRVASRIAGRMAYCDCHTSVHPTSADSGCDPAEGPRRNPLAVAVRTALLAYAGSGHRQLSTIGHGCRTPQPGHMHRPIALGLERLGKGVTLVDPTRMESLALVLHVSRHTHGSRPHQPHDRDWAWLHPTGEGPAGPRRGCGNGRSPWSEASIAHSARLGGC